MEEQKSISIEEDIARNVLDKTNLYNEHDGKFAFEIIDDAPERSKLKLLNTKGEFVDAKDVTVKEQQEYFWRHHQMTIGIIMFASALCILGVILTVSNRYYSFIFQLLAGLVHWLVSQGLGLFHL